MTAGRFGPTADGARRGGRATLGAMDTSGFAEAAPAGDRARRVASWLWRPWPPLSLFVLAAALYTGSSTVASGRLAGPVQAIALLALFAATPVAAQLVRRIASRRLRAMAALAAGILCAAMWIALMALYFSGAADAPPRARVLVAGAGGALLYLPLIWLGGGGLRLEQSSGWAARIDARWLAAIAAGEGVFWLCCAWALLRGWARWQHLDVAIGWGPMSIVVLQVAGVACAADAVRAVRRGTRIVFWPIAAGAAWLAWWHVRIAAFYLAMSGWMH